MGLFLFVLFSVWGVWVWVKRKEYLRFSSLPQKKPGHPLPLISILVPARNEIGNIARCVESLLSDDYPFQEVLVLDDGSTDGTGEYLQGVQHPCFRWFPGKPLPQGWVGKNWACHQLWEKAKGSILVFCDADSFHTPGSFRDLVALVRNSGADLLSGIPYQQILSLGEAVTYSFVGILIFALLPLRWVSHPKRKFSLASGNFMVFSREGYAQSGGFAGIRNILADDVALSHRVKETGGKVVYVDITRFSTIRMYHGFREGFLGVSKSLVSSLQGSPVQLLGAGVALGVFEFLPWVALVASFFTGGLGWALAALALNFAIRFSVDHMHGIPAWCWVLQPVHFPVLVAMGIHALVRQKKGKTTWKGRNVPQP
ncbi:MAG TPA: glycosyltransferase [Thermotogota bacterium]|nr:glycosyltransferase [Thermotogota bacterium]HRW91710.1 glycosyltransferase [Thermotogota bacterium]